MTATVLYGVPGVGKSTLAAALAARQGLRHLELDALRPQLQARDGARSRLVLDYTTDAWRRLGELSDATAVAGLCAVRASFAEAVAEALAGHGGEGYVAESAVIDPRVARAAGATPRLVTIGDPAVHYARFFVHRERGSAADEQFSAARRIQDHLISEASDLGIEIIENGADRPAVT